MNKYMRKRAAQILGCKPDEVPDDIRSVRAAIRPLKARALEAWEAQRKVKHG